MLINVFILLSLAFLAVCVCWGLQCDKTLEKRQEVEVLLKKVSDLDRRKWEIVKENHRLQLEIEILHEVIDELTR